MKVSHSFKEFISYALFLSKNCQRNTQCNGLVVNLDTLILEVQGKHIFRPVSGLERVPRGTQTWSPFPCTGKSIIFFQACSGGTARRQQTRNTDVGLVEYQLSGL
jgi:hypothetical protein